MIGDIEQPPPAMNEGISDNASPIIDEDAYEYAKEEYLRLHSAIRLGHTIDEYTFEQHWKSYCQIWCLRLVGHAAIWSGFVASIPSLNVTPVITLAR